jgi:hypothetical protein
MNDDTPKQLRDSILDRIHAGEVRMHPRAYFTLRAAGAVFVSILALIASVLLVSFVFFSIEVSGKSALLGHGGSGISTFISLFPWGLLFITFLLIALADWSLRNFGFAYRTSMLVLFASVFVVSAIAGLILAQTPFHANLLERADHNELPIIGEWYEGIHDDSDTVDIFIRNEDVGESR